MATFTISTELVVTLKYYYEKNISVVRRHHFDFFLIGFTPCKAEQPVRGMELQEKKHKKITEYRKSV